MFGKKKTESAPKERWVIQIRKWGNLNLTGEDAGVTEVLGPWREFHYGYQWPNDKDFARAQAEKLAQVYRHVRIAKVTNTTHVEYEEVIV